MALSSPLNRGSRIPRAPNPGAVASAENRLAAALRSALLALTVGIAVAPLSAQA